MVGESGGGDLDLCGGRATSGGPVGDTPKK